MNRIGYFGVHQIRQIEGYTHRHTTQTVRLLKFQTCTDLGKLKIISPQIWVRYCYIV